MSRENVAMPNFHSYHEILNEAENKSQPPLLQNGPPKDEDTCIIFWSSGTTGLPKGIEHSFKSFRYITYTKLNKQDGGIGKTLTTTCMFHCGGFGMIFDNLLQKSPVIFNHGTDIDIDAAQILFREIDCFKPIRIVFGSHHMLQLSKQKPTDKSLDLNSVLMASPMGSTVPDTLYSDLKKSLTSLVLVAHGYSQTECYPTLLSLTFDLKLATLGKIGPNIAIKLIDPESGKLCGPNEIGELYAKGGVTMKGYLNNPEENSKFFAEDGWYRSGDLARFNARGMLFYEGRHKELIKYKNCHVSPLEIEKIICEHPGVAEAAVFGRPDDLVQELVTAAVVKTTGSSVTAQEIIDHVDQTVDEAKKLRGGVIFVDKLPKNPMGKVQRRKLLHL